MEPKRTNQQAALGAWSQRLLLSPLQVGEELPSVTHSLSGLPMCTVSISLEAHSPVSLFPLGCPVLW